MLTPSVTSRDGRTTRPARRILPLLPLLPALLWACSDSGFAPPDIAGVEVVSGDAQAGPVDVALPNPVTARVVDSGGQEVVWALYAQVASGDGKIAVPGSQAAGNGATLLAPTRGEAAVTWSPGASSPQRLRFFVVPSEGDTLEAVATATVVAASRR